MSNILATADHLTACASVRKHSGVPRTVLPVPRVTTTIPIVNPVHVSPMELWQMTARVFLFASQRMRLVLTSSVPAETTTVELSVMNVLLDSTTSLTVFVSVPHVKED